MNGVQVPQQIEASSIKAKEDARQMQASIIDASRRTGTDPPKYALIELIGKGSYGRVYKGKDMITGDIIAVKIIDIDESDTANPRNADSYNEFLKEITALKTLSEKKARNINHIIDALPVGQTTWMITEYCGGGSVATLMKPTAPGGLQEKWIIPIVREVAEAIRWVHDAGIIHRDIKCANVLITERGEVQLCDFGVASTLETKLDKRSTFIGTLYWMAPELFDPNPSYGKEVDIWAFGCMVYEIATGLPPNVDIQVPFGLVEARSNFHVPRLEEGNYTHDLRSLVAYCLEELPGSRPTISQVQGHSYIWNSNSRYPTSSLSHLVHTFKIWEDRVGSRTSLFKSGGAQSLSKGALNPTADDEWIFSTTSDFNQEISKQPTLPDLHRVHNASSTASGHEEVSEDTSRPQFHKPSRRRLPPHALVRLPVPLEKIFDPNIVSNYEENSRDHYGRHLHSPMSDLPLRDDASQIPIKDTMIDLDAHDFDTGLSRFPGAETIKASKVVSLEGEGEGHGSTLHDVARSALSGQADISINRRTQDWKFPMISPPISTDPEISHFPDRDLPLSSAIARESLIDLDMSLPDVTAPYACPPTANSVTDSTSSDQMTSGSPSELENHTSLYTSSSPEVTLKHKFRLPKESAFPYPLLDDKSGVNNGKLPDFSASDTESTMQHSPFPPQTAFNPHAKPPYALCHLPNLPLPPSEKALSGLAAHDEMKEELQRMLSSMSSQLEAFRVLYASTQILDLSSLY